MSQETYQKKEGPSQTSVNLCKDYIEEYKICHKRERDFMWMKYRHLRKFFDEIEQTTQFHY